MPSRLLQKVTKELLDKFGAGSHSPGSGSAAAFDGLLAAHLTCTVIDLTERYKQHYKSHIDELLAIREHLHKHTIPALENLFQKDSDQFDEVIASRKAKKGITDQTKLDFLQATADQELRKATVIPIQIAKLCHQVGQMAVKVFDKGFRSARGDSAVAIYTALGGMRGCLSIIDLNFCSLPADEWMRKTRAMKAPLNTQCDELDHKSKLRQQRLQREADQRFELEQFRHGNLGDAIRSTKDLEQLVHDLQVTLWKYRDKIWLDEEERPKIPMEVLKPQDVLRYLMGYRFTQEATLGTHRVGNETFEIAGMINKKDRHVRISQQFPVETMRFTAAHELAHAILHRTELLHRDKAIDGSSSSLHRDAKEVQADKFAALFLMPAKGVRATFEKFFQTKQFKITTDTAFALGSYKLSELKAKCPSKRSLAMMLAQVTFYAGNSFKSLAEFYGVSNTTMAIRLEELDLVEY